MLWPSASTPFSVGGVCVCVGVGRCACSRILMREKMCYSVFVAWISSVEASLDSHDIIAYFLAQPPSVALC